METTGRIANANLAQSAVHALKWRYLGTVVEVGLRLMIGVILARLLSPDAFGLVGMALIVIGLGRLFGDLGFGAAVIQRRSLTQEHINAAFTGCVTIGLLLFSGLWFLAPTISRLFNQDALTSILRVIGISFIFSGISLTSVCLLRRELRFRTLAGIESVSYAVGFGVMGIPLALSGYGVWSLAAANVVQVLCLATLATYFIKRPFWPHLGSREYRDLLRVGSAEMLNNITNYFAENLDFFVIGKWLGAAALGLYNRSFYLMKLPVRQFSVSLSTVMFPLYSNIQEDVPRLRSAFLRTLSITAIIAMPVLFAMAAVPEVVIGGLFGEQWKPAAGALQILCLIGPFWAFIHIFGAVSHARGYIFSEARRQLVYLIIMGVAIWFLFPYGIEGVALAVGLGTFARYVLLAHLSVRLAGIRWKEFFVAQIPGCLLGISVSVSVYVAAAVANTYGMSDVSQLLLIGVVSMLSLIMSVLLFPASWFGDLYPWAIDRFSSTLPHWVRKLIMARISAARIGLVSR